MQVFKGVEVKGVEIKSPLYVKPGEKTWSIAHRLNDTTIWLKGGLASQSCPAHPHSSLNQHGDANNWKYWTKGDGYGNGGVLLRCATHDAIHSKWLFDQGKEGHISKEKVGALLCEEDKDGSCLLSLLDVDVQLPLPFFRATCTSFSAVIKEYIKCIF